MNLYRFVFVVISSSIVCAILSIIGNELLGYKWNKGNWWSVVGHLALERILGALLLLVFVWAITK